MPYQGKKTWIRPCSEANTWVSLLQHPNATEFFRKLSFTCRAVTKTSFLLDLWSLFLHNQDTAHIIFAPHWESKLLFCWRNNTTLLFYINANWLLQLLWQGQPFSSYKWNLVYQSISLLLTTYSTLVCQNYYNTMVNLSSKNCGQRWWMLSRRFHFSTILHSFLTVIFCAYMKKCKRRKNCCPQQS